DYGKLTDNNGKTVDFRNVVLIMTTNAGAADMSKPAIGFMRDSREGEDTDAINRLFTPEFRNRLDAVIPFSALTPEIVVHVVDKFVRELSAQLADKRVAIDIDEEARLWLAERGYEPLFGARPLARLIQEKIKRPLADQLLFGDLAKGGRVLVTVKEGELHFVITPGGGPSLLSPPEDGEAEGDEGDVAPPIPEPA
ncbi:MAG: AAA family ATPase, partial [Pseudomonadota bacterium]